MKFLVSALVFFAFPSSSWAFVPHDFPEIYIHQIGHVYFALSCIFILWTIAHNRLQKEKGWRYLFFTEVFFILWNVDTFIGHITEFWIGPVQVTGSRIGMDYFLRVIAIEGREYLYYITKFDNLILVPAMLLFYKGLAEHLKEEGKSPVGAYAVLPLLPIMLVDITGAFVILFLSICCLVAAVKLYKRNRENTLWNYMLWLSVSYVLFSVSRSAGHILNRFLTPCGYESAWRYIEPISGSFNTFTFIVIGTVNMFFFRSYQSYLRISGDNRKIEAINADLSELNHEIETLIAERTMSLMALTVADRVRNPAAVIGWTCKRILEKEDVSERLGENLKDIIDESERLESIVREFEALLKSKQSMFKYEDVNEVVTGVINIVEKEAKDKKVNIIASLSEQPLRINTQKNLLRAAVFHVMRNAIEATNEEGIISVSTREEAGMVIVAISDTGSGIPKEDLDRIFDPFFSTKRHRFGIGLPLVRQVVSEHMGEIRVDSEMGKGTTFKMIFPARWTERK